MTPSTIYVTKYATDCGVVPMTPEGDPSQDGSIKAYAVGGDLTQRFRHGEWFGDRETALADARLRRDKAISQAENRIAIREDSVQEAKAELERLRALTFEEPAP